jgi:branched-chain amino acid transport system substrate-binding protein
MVGNDDAVKGSDRNMRSLATYLLAALIGLVGAFLGVARAQAAEPVLVGLDAEFSLINSTSAQAVEQGIRTAMDEINAAGGVLGGRRLELVTRDNHSVPARATDNLKELAAMKDMVAVFCARFSPVVLETLPLYHQLGLILLDPWASADGIIDNGFKPNYAFRLSLRDQVAIPAMMRHLQAKGAKRVGLLLANTGWGRSGQKAAERYVAEHGGPQIVAAAWYNWGERSLVRYYSELRAKGADAILFVANDAEGAVLVRELAALPAEARIPLVAHWGITGARFQDMTGAEALKAVDLSFVQTFSFASAKPDRLERFMASYRKLYGPVEPASIVSPVGVAHAYELTRILARALDKAGTTDREAVRVALEQVRDYAGLMHDFPRPFSPDNHEALGPGEVFMAAFAADGTIRPLARQ